MKLATYEGHVENGAIKIDHDVSLPEKTKLYIVVREEIEQPKLDVVLPKLDPSRVIHMRSPRLVNPNAAEKSKMDVTRDEAQ